MKEKKHTSLQPFLPRNRESLLNSEPILAEKNMFAAIIGRVSTKSQERARQINEGKLKKNHWFPFASYETLIFEGGLR